MTAICRTCCKPVNDPYRRRNGKGEIVEGCIAEDHAEALRGLLMPTSQWHFRKEAVAFRKQSAARIKAMLRK